jgi:multidrug transporter EmrE-like cation transporter
MTMAAFGLVLLAAAVHAGWNALAKQRQDILAFFWGLTLAALVIYAPLFAVIVRREPPSMTVLPYLIASSLAEVAYYACLARAYQASDLSLVYPVARGTGVLLVPLLSIVILGERPSPAAGAGIGMVFGGILWLHVPALRATWRRRPLGSVISPPALLTGLAIATYSLIDGAGVQHAHPVVYLYLAFVLIVVWLGPYVLRYRRQALVREWHERWPVLAGGAAVFGTYALILAAFRLAPVAYVVLMREISIVFGAWLGVRLLGEPFGGTRLAACCVVAAGVITIGIGG